MTEEEKYDNFRTLLKEASSYKKTNLDKAIELIKEAISIFECCNLEGYLKLLNYLSLNQSTEYIEVSQNLLSNIDNICGDSRFSMFQWKSDIFNRMYLDWINLLKVTPKENLENVVTNLHYFTISYIYYFFVDYIYKGFLKVETPNALFQLIEPQISSNYIKQLNKKGISITKSGIVSIFDKLISEHIDEFLYINNSYRKYDIRYIQDRRKEIQLTRAILKEFGEEGVNSIHYILFHDPKYVEAITKVTEIYSYYYNNQFLPYLRENMSDM